MLRWLVLLSLSATAITCPVRAGSLVYTSLAAWQASSPGTTTALDFESTSTGLYSSFSYSPYSFTAPGDYIIVNTPAPAGTGSGHYLTSLGSSVINITMASSVYGIAFNLGSNAASAATASILATDINGLQYLSNSVTTSGPSGPAIFWGLRADVQLATIKVSFSTAIPQLDNLRYSNTALPPQGPVIPEPAPWALVATGGVLFLVIRHPKPSRSGRRAERR